jgi:hypothetical protein
VEGRQEGVADVDVEAGTSTLAVPGPESGAVPHPWGTEKPSPHTTIWLVTSLVVATDSGLPSRVSVHAPILSREVAGRGSHG